MNLIDEKLKEFEQSRGIAWLYSDSRQKFFNQLTQEVSVISGQFVSKVRGTAIHSMEDLFISKLSQGGFTRNKNFSERYVSPFPKRSAEKIGEHKTATRNILSEQLELDRYVFKSESAKNKLIELISENFLPVDTKDGIRYHKIHENAIPSINTWSVLELLQKVGAGKYIDKNKTELQQKLHDAELKEHAMRIAEDPKNGREVLRLIDQLKAAENGLTVGKILKVEIRDIQTEFRKKAIVEFGKPEQSHTLDDKNFIQGKVAQETAALDNLDPIKKAVEAIEPEAQPTEWSL